MNQYEKENKEVCINYLNRIFFDAKFENENYERIELDFDPRCNLGCKYCYLERFGDQLYPVSLIDDEERWKNITAVIDWMETNDFKPKVDIFSGEPFIHQVVFDTLHYMADRIEAGKLKIKSIMVPTNGTFILDDNITAEIENLLSRYKQIGIPLWLSLSVDGKYCEQNRPMKSGKEPRDDKYYDKLFKFAKKYGFAFHPMVDSRDIHLWKKNFLWFQEMFKKYEIPFHNVYLLEVRNYEWTNEEIEEYGKFIDFMLRWEYEFFNGNLDDLSKFWQNRGFNILSSTFNSVGRGILCSIQSTLFIRLADLMLIPCHRLSYDNLNYGKLIKDENNKIVDIDIYRPELLIGIMTTDRYCAPYCENCLIKDFCCYGCLGSQYEVTGDILTPIPTVCKLYHKKISTIINTAKDLGILDFIKSYVNQDFAKSLITIEEVMKNDRKL